MQNSRVRSYKCFIYTLCIILAPLGLLVIPLMPIILFGSICHKITKKSKNLGSNCPLIILPLKFLVVLVLSLLSLIGIILGFFLIVFTGSIVLPPIGCVLLIAKLVLMLCRSTKQSFYEYPRSIN